MTLRRRGRPPRDQSAVTPDAILSAALDILDAEGADALTMRALAARLGVNPMTPYHYFTDRDALIKALAEKVYAQVMAPDEGDACARLKGLLSAYQAQVVRHPALTLSIFSSPLVFPAQARRITAEVEALLQEMGFSPDRSRLWVNILVDFTHGAALATAMQFGTQSVPIDDGYPASLDALLEQFDT